MRCSFTVVKYCCLLWLIKVRCSSCTKEPRAASDPSVVIQPSGSLQRADWIDSFGFMTLKADNYFKRFARVQQLILFRCSKWFCLSVRLSACLFICFSVCLCLIVSPSGYFSACLSVCLPFSFYISPSVCMPVYQFVSLSVHVCLSVRLSVHLYIRLSHSWATTKTEAGLWCPGFDKDVFITLTACCDLDLWSPESNQFISRGYWIFLVSFVEIAVAVREVLW